MYVITNARKKIQAFGNLAQYVRRQKNGVVIFCAKEDADALYMNDNDTYWPIESDGYHVDSHSLHEVEAVPAGLTPGFYYYHAGEFYSTEEDLSALAEQTVNALAGEVILELAESQILTKSAVLDLADAVDALSAQLLEGGVS